jgi:hypothetical protein
MLATCAWLAGCNTMQRGAELAVVEPEPQKAVMVPGPPARQASEAEGLIAYFAHLRKLPGSELAREHEAARQAYGRARTDYNGVRLAMLVGLPNAPFYDETRALELLDPVARNAEGRLAGLAALLASQIQSAGGWTRTCRRYSRSSTP